MKKLLLAVLVFGSLLSAQVIFKAAAVQAGQDEVLFICRNNVVNSFNSQIATHYYMTPQDKILAKEILNMAVSGEFQSYTFQDEAGGKKIRLTAGDEGLTLMILKDGETIEKSLKMPDDMVFNPGLQTYIRSEMQALTAGKSRKISFFDPVRADFVKMILEPVSLEADDDELSVIMRPAGWFKKNCSATRTLAIEKNTARILKSHGSCVVVPDGRRVEITYEYASPYFKEEKAQKILMVE